VKLVAGLRGGLGEHPRTGVALVDDRQDTHELHTSREPGE